MIRPQHFCIRRIHHICNFVLQQELAVVVSCVLPFDMLIFNYIIIIYLTLQGSHTYSSRCYGDGDGSEEGEIIPWINAVPQRGQDEGQC